MNKKGHVSLALAAGSMAIYTHPSYSLADWSQGWMAVLLVACAGIGGLAPDLDHKTSTASKSIQFSARNRRTLRAISGSCFAAGLVLTLLWLASQFELANWASWLPEGWAPYGLQVVQSGPFVLGGGVLFLLMARLRTLILLGGGAALLIGAYMNHWHWIASFAGIALLLLPLVKHRGMIHTPEFAMAMTIGLLSFAAQQGEPMQAAATGFIIGWWTHLAGDCFGSEGIHLLLIPKLRIAMHLFANGGATERLVIGICTLATTIIWFALLLEDANGMTWLASLAIFHDMK